MITHHPRKRFSQNFLHDYGVIERIVHAIAPSDTDHIVEIGPGLGALTKAILPVVDHLDVIEIDRDLAAKLAVICNDAEKLRIHEADALTFDFSQLVTVPQSLRIVGNLPYNISTPLLFHLLSQINVIKDMHFMLQKEVVERLAASVNTKAYGRLSIMVQYYCYVEALFKVPPSAFTPAPKVDSAVVYLSPRPPTVVAKNLLVFADVVRTAFNHRRKTLRNCLRDLVTVAQLQTIAIDPQLRPEQLTVEEFVKISNLIV